MDFCSALSLKNLIDFELFLVQRYKLCQSRGPYLNDIGHNANNANNGNQNFPLSFKYGYFDCPNFPLLFKYVHM